MLPLSSGIASANVTLPFKYLTKPISLLIPFYSYIDYAAKLYTKKSRKTMNSDLFISDFMD